MIIYASTQDPTYNDFNNFLLHYGFFLALGAGILVATVVVLLLVLQNRRKEKDKPVVKKSYSHSEIYDALGGKENVLSHNKAGSRISLTLKNYDVVDEAKLNTLGVDSIIKMSNKITLVVKDDPEAFNKLFD